MPARVRKAVEYGEGVPAPPQDEVGLVLVRLGGVAAEKTSLPAGRAGCPDTPFARGPRCSSFGRRRWARSWGHYSSGAGGGQRVETGRGHGFTKTPFGRIIMGGGLAAWESHGPGEPEEKPIGRPARPLRGRWCWRPRDAPRCARTASTGPPADTKPPLNYCRPRPGAGGGTGSAGRTPGAAGDRPPPGRGGSGPGPAPPRRAGGGLQRRAIGELGAIAGLAGGNGAGPG